MLKDKIPNDKMPNDKMPNDKRQNGKILIRKMLNDLIRKAKL